MSGAGSAREQVHASAVALGERALLITGESGTGKTTLALEMLALGASLIGDDQIAAAQEAEPLFARTTLGAGVYQGVDADVTVLGVPNVLVASSEMSDDLAYTITKTMFENIADLQAVHPAANQTTVAFTLEATPIPLHPGALRYYEKIGAEIPDRLRP